MAMSQATSNDRSAGIPDVEVTIAISPRTATTLRRDRHCRSFRGKSRVQQHQIVYEALKGEMGGNCTRWRCIPDAGALRRGRAVGHSLPCPERGISAVMRAFGEPSFGPMIFFERQG